MPRQEAVRSSPALQEEGWEEQAASRGRGSDLAHRLPSGGATSSVPWGLWQSLRGQRPPSSILVHPARAAVASRIISCSGCWLLREGQHLGFPRLGGAWYSWDSG